MTWGLRHPHMPPDLIVLDRPQADMEGVRLLQRLHDTAEHLPILLVGHDPTPTDQVRWLKLWRG